MRYQFVLLYKRAKRRHGYILHCAHPYLCGCFSAARSLKSTTSKLSHVRHSVPSCVRSSSCGKELYWCSPVKNNVQFIVFLVVVIEYIIRWLENMLRMVRND